ncbi:MAG: helix-turn-helix domain-containing protein [Phenylobacterium sp.]|uniref:helix-turn-helix domain-containing protein n=1 Tax=Phenylobacterium sp. TaxID=1871053 RepID=UPI00391D6892
MSHHSVRVSTIIDEATRRLAHRIRVEREARGWSQGELAERSEVSKAMIGKIERGEASPTAALLGKLSGALQLTLAALLTRAEAEGGRKTAAADQPVWRDPGTGYLRRQVFARGDHPVELVEVELPAGARVDLPAASYAFIRQVVWVLSGTLAIEEGGRRTELAAGDAYAFGEPAQSSFINPAPEPCAYLVAVSRR